MSQPSEEAIAAWMQLIAAVENRRVVSGLSFNEALVCNLLARRREEGGCLTASELRLKTRILKFQMNAILRSLERRGVISRQQSRQDRRQIEIRLLPEGSASYEAAHRRVLALARRLVDAMGEEPVRQLIPLLHQVVDTFTTIQQEV